MYLKAILTRADETQDTAVAIKARATIDDLNAILPPIAVIITAVDLNVTKRPNLNDLTTFSNALKKLEAGHAELEQAVFSKAPVGEISVQWTLDSESAIKDIRRDFGTIMNAHVSSFRHIRATLAITYSCTRV